METIAAIGSIWNAVFNPVVGYFADKVKIKYDRRHPLMALIFIPVVFLAVAAIAVYKSPINKKFYNEMLEEERK